MPVACSKFATAILLMMFFSINPVEKRMLLKEKAFGMCGIEPLGL